MLSMLEKRIRHNASIFANKADAMMVASFQVKSDGREKVGLGTFDTSHLCLIILPGSGPMRDELRAQARKNICSGTGVK